MSQVMSQDPPLQNCTNTINQSPVASKDVTMVMGSPMKQSKIFDFIDLTTPKKCESKSPRFKCSAVIIDEIVISDSDDESPPKRMKNTDTPYSTPLKSPIPTPHTRNVPTNSPRIKPKISPIRNPTSNPQLKLTLPTNNARHSTPIQDNETLQVSNPNLDSIITNSNSTGTPFVSDIIGSIEVQNMFEEEHLMPTDIITVELFASKSNVCLTPYKTPLNSPFLHINNENFSNSSLPEPNFVISQADQEKTTGSQLAEQLHGVAIQDKPATKLGISPQTHKSPINPSPSPEVSQDPLNIFYTPNNNEPLANISNRTEMFSTPVLFKSHSNLLSIDKMEQTRKRYIPINTHSNLNPGLIEGKELPIEWIDDKINLPLESRTSFSKVNSLQFVQFSITTPRVKITASLISPLLTCLIRTQDENAIVPTARLLCDVIKSHPAATPDNIACYASVFTWEILTNSVDILLESDQLLVPFDSLLKLYCDIMESELLYCSGRELSYIRAIFWPGNSPINLSSNIKSLIDYISKLFFKQNSSICWLFKIFEQVLEWSLRENEVVWHVEATLEFRNQFSTLDSQSYSQLIESISPAWFAGYLAQKRLQEISVSPQTCLQFSSNLSEFFSNYLNLLPSHFHLGVPVPTTQGDSLYSLIRASHFGDCEEIKRLIKQGCDPNACDCKKWSSLHRACYSGEVRSIEAIVQASKENGIYLNVIQKNVSGATPLHTAAKCGKNDVCMSLLRVGGPSLLLHRDNNHRMPCQVATDSALINLLTIGHGMEVLPSSFHTISKEMSDLRVPIDVSIIREFELMLCLSIYGIFMQGQFTMDDLIACRRVDSFLRNLTLQINKSQSQPVELKRFSALVRSLFA